MCTRSDMSCEISVDNVSDNFDKNCYDLLIPSKMLQLKILKQYTKQLAKVNLMNFMRTVCEFKCCHIHYKWNHSYSWWKLNFMLNVCQKS